VEDASAEESAACGSPSPAFPGPERLRDNPYDAAFWKAFLANFLVTVSVAVLFRYADFITFLDGTELHLGWIVGIGMVGSLSMRPVDRGPDGRLAGAFRRQVWATRLSDDVCGCGDSAGPGDERLHDRTATSTSRGAAQLVLRPGPRLGCHWLRQCSSAGRPTRRHWRSRRSQWHAAQSIRYR